MCDDCYERIMLGHDASMEAVRTPIRHVCLEQDRFDGEPCLPD